MILRPEDLAADQCFGRKFDLVYRVLRLDQLRQDGKATRKFVLCGWRTHFLRVIDVVVRNERHEVVASPGLFVPVPGQIALAVDVGEEFDVTPHDSIEFQVLEAVHAVPHPKGPHVAAH